MAKLDDVFNNPDIPEYEPNPEDRFQLQAFGQLLANMTKKLVKEKDSIVASLHIQLDTENISDEIYDNGGIQTKIAIQAYCPTEDPEVYKKLTQALKIELANNFDVEIKPSTDSPFIHLSDDEDTDAK